MALGSFWRRFVDILPKPPRYVATVVAYPSAGRYTLQLPGGASVQARGASGYAPGSKVFVTGDVVEGPAPSLTSVVIDV